MRLFVFGLGYTASPLAAALETRDWRIAGVGRADFTNRAQVEFEVARATHILSSVPPTDSDPVLETYGDAIATSAAWLGYLSTPGVYGVSGGAWVDETAPTGTGRRSARAVADAAWLARGARGGPLPGGYRPAGPAPRTGPGGLAGAPRVSPVPGLWGPGRSPRGRVPAVRVEAPGQVFSRIHVDDIV